MNDNIIVRWAFDDSRLVTYETTTPKGVPVKVHALEIKWFSIGLMNPERPMTSSGQPSVPHVTWRKKPFKNAHHYALSMHLGRRVLVFSYLNLRRATQ